MVKGARLEAEQQKGITISESSSRGLFECNECHGRNQGKRKFRGGITLLGTLPGFATELTQNRGRDNLHVASASYCEGNGVVLDGVDTPLSLLGSLWTGPLEEGAA